MRRTRKFILTVLAVLLAAIGTGASAAYAQQYPAPGGPPTSPSLAAPVLSQPPAPPPPETLTSGLQVSVTPYLWLSSVHTNDQHAARARTDGRQQHRGLSASRASPIGTVHRIGRISRRAVQPAGRYHPSPGRHEHHHPQYLFQRRQRSANSQYRDRRVSLPRGRRAGSVARRRRRLSRLGCIERGDIKWRPVADDEHEPLVRMGRSADRRPLSPRFGQRVRVDGLWRCRWLRPRRACRLAVARHARLHA
jgi:hypothetical protein